VAATAAASSAKRLGGWGAALAGEPWAPEETPWRNMAESWVSSVPERAEGAMGWAAKKRHDTSATQPTYVLAA